MDVLSHITMVFQESGQEEEVDDQTGQNSRDTGHAGSKRAATQVSTGKKARVNSEAHPDAASAHPVVSASAHPKVSVCAHPLSREIAQSLVQKALDVWRLKREVSSAEENVKIREVKDQPDRTALQSAVRLFVTQTLAASNEPWAAQFSSFLPDLDLKDHEDHEDHEDNEDHVHDIPLLIEKYTEVKGEHAARMANHYALQTACDVLKSQLALQLQEYKILYDDWYAGATENERSILTSLLPQPLI